MLTPLEFLIIYWQETWKVKRRSEADPGHEYMPMSPVLPLTLVECEDVLDPENNTPDRQSIEIHNGQYKSTHVRFIGEIVTEHKYMIPTTSGPVLERERLTFQLDRCGTSFETLQQYIHDKIAVSMHIPRGKYGEPQLDLEGREVPPREPGWIAPPVDCSELPKVQTKIVLFYTNIGDSNAYNEQITEETFADIRYRLHTRAIPYDGRHLWVFWMEMKERSDSGVEVPKKVVSVPISLRPGTVRPESSRAASLRQQPYQAGFPRAPEMARSRAPTAGPSRLSVSRVPSIPQEVEEAVQEEVPANSGRPLFASRARPPRGPSMRPPPPRPRVDSATGNCNPSNERRSNALGKRRAHC